MKQSLGRLAGIALLLTAHAATATVLDTLIPPGIPGLGAPSPLSVIGRINTTDLPIPLQFNTLTLQPRITIGAGYDSAPNGTDTGTSLFTATPTLTVTDIPAGFGAYISANTNLYSSEFSQNTSGYTLAVGEAAIFPRNTITFAAALARTTLSSIGLNQLSLSHPIAFTAATLIASDKILAGMFALTPLIQLNTARFDALPTEDVTQLHTALTAEYTPGGPTRLITEFEATKSQYRAKSQNAASYALLTGLDMDATGLWEFRILAGAAWRLPATGATRVAPVTEAAATWLPTELDTLTLILSHEINDPDQIGPAGYTLTQATLSYTHELRRNIDLSSTLTAEDANYFGSRLAEQTLNTSTSLAWHLNRALALNAAYVFNTRQANFLPPASEHLLTLNATWTP